MNLQVRPISPGVLGRDRDAEARLGRRFAVSRTVNPEAPCPSCKRCGGDRSGGTTLVDALRSPELRAAEERWVDPACHAASPSRRQRGLSAQTDGAGHHGPAARRRPRARSRRSPVLARKSPTSWQRARRDAGRKRDRRVFRSARCGLSRFARGDALRAASMASSELRSQSQHQLQHIAPIAESARSRRQARRTSRQARPPSEDTAAPIERGRAGRRSLLQGGIHTETPAATYLDIAAA